MAKKKTFGGMLVVILTFWTAGTGCAKEKTPEGKWGQTLDNGVQIELIIKEGSFSVEGPGSGFIGTYTLDKDILKLSVTMGFTQIPIQLKYSISNGGQNLILTAVDSDWDSFNGEYERVKE